MVHPCSTNHKSRLRIPTSIRLIPAAGIGGTGIEGRREGLQGVRDAPRVHGKQKPLSLRVKLDGVIQSPTLSHFGHVINHLHAILVTQIK